MSFSFTKLIPILSAFMANWMKNRDHNSKIKNFDKSEEKLNILENLMVRLERKIKETREEVDTLHRQIMISRTINIALSLIIIIGLFLNYYK